MSFLTSYQIPGGREDLSDVVSILAERETPFLNLVMDQSMAATFRKHEWVNTRLVGFKDNLNGAIDDVVTTITVYGAFQGASTKYVAGTILRIGDEYLKVTVVNSGTSLDVQRGFGGTTAAAHADGAPVEIVAKPKAEGHTSQDDDSEVGARDYNLTQIFYRRLSLSGTAQAIDVVGNENKMTTQIQRKMKELLKELERTMILGLRTQDGSGDNRTMGGLAQYISQADSSGGALTAAKIDSVVFKLLENGAEPDILLVSNAQKNKLNNMKEARVTGAHRQSEHMIDNLVDVYHSDAGPLKIVRSNDVLPWELFVLDSSKIKVCPLQGRRFAMEKLAKTGDSDEAQIIGEYTCEFRNPEAHYRITGLTT
jgi:hypothetical protein